MPKAKAAVSIALAKAGEPEITTDFQKDDKMTGAEISAAANQ